jgi:hypothetical protein
MIAAGRPENEMVAPVTPAGEAATAGELSDPLPPLDELVKRIPPATRRLAEELFRVRFVRGQRAPAQK